MAVTEPAPAAPPRPRVTVTPLDVLLLVAVAALVAFPLVAKLAADVQPIPPRTGVPLPPLPPHPRGGELRHLPAGLDSSVADLEASAVAALGPGGTRELFRRAAQGTRSFG